MKSVESNGVLWVYDPTSPEDFDDYKSNKEVYDYLREYENLENIRSMKQNVEFMRRTQDSVLLVGSIIGGAILIGKAMKWVRNKKKKP